jgi:hypothetical protein
VVRQAAAPRGDALVAEYALALDRSLVTDGVDRFRRAKGLTVRNRRACQRLLRARLLSATSCRPRALEPTLATTGARAEPT